MDVITGSSGDPILQKNPVNPVNNPHGERQVADRIVLVLSERSERSSSSHPSGGGEDENEEDDDDEDENERGGRQPPPTPWFAAIVGIGLALMVRGG